MHVSSKHCCILNGGNGAWAFEDLAAQLASTLGLEVSTHPRSFNSLLQFEALDALQGHNTFVPLSSIRLASDKRLLAQRFAASFIPVPETHLIADPDELASFAASRRDREWCLKYPTSCGANGHRLIQNADTIPTNWPRPFVLQEFIRLKDPEVYRTFCAGGEIFGWAVRCFPKGTPASPWVAHARGARYKCSRDVPKEIIPLAEKVFNATGLFDSFGCVDLIRRPTGEWLALEVGTDGLFNHVDRDFNNETLAKELEHHLRDAFWKSASSLN